GAGVVGGVRGGAEVVGPARDHAVGGVLEAAADAGGGGGQVRGAAAGGDGEPAVGGTGARAHGADHRVRDAAVLRERPQLRRGEGGQVLPAQPARAEEDDGRAGRRGRGGVVVVLRGAERGAGD